MKTYCILFVTLISFRLLCAGQCITRAQTNATHCHYKCDGACWYGQIINNATVLINDGKIAAVGTTVNYT